MKLPNNVKKKGTPKKEGENGKKEKWSRLIQFTILNNFPPSHMNIGLLKKKFFLLSWDKKVSTGWRLQVTFTNKKKDGEIQTLKLKLVGIQFENCCKWKGGSMIFRFLLKTIVVKCWMMYYNVRYAKGFKVFDSLPLSMAHLPLPLFTVLGRIPS